ncbi:MAG: muconolactone Delta-isomerase family protein, partial [Rubrobacter sp.]
QMAQYLVNMDLVKTDPLLPLDQLAELVQDTLLPSIEVLIALRSRGKIVAGGYPMGHRAIVFVMEAESEEDLYRTLEDLPLWDEVNTKVTPLQRFEELQDRKGTSGPLAAESLNLTSETPSSTHSSGE